jgi:thiamine biosynthesis lipoprotein
VTGVLERDAFRAMGTLCTAAVVVQPGDHAHARVALEAAHREVEACERALSRFDEGSDLSRLNRAGGAWIDVDVRLIEALAAALKARTETCGRFDPTILPALSAAGYDRSFELLAQRPARRVVGWRAGARVEIDSQSRRARLERGAAVDLGGIGKGFASSSALHAMRTAWPALTGALVDLGGDIGVWGAAPGGGPWRIDIADPWGPNSVAGTLELAYGGVATSGRDTRRFGPGGRLHHLIDPATGMPATVGPLSVTVVAESTVEAEAHATALAVADVGEAGTLLASRPGLSALLIPEVGDPVVVGRLPLVSERSRPSFVLKMQGGRFQ